LPMREPLIKREWLVCVVGTLVPACAAFSQIPHADHALNWTEVIAGTSAPVSSPNGMLDPGEGALVGLSVSFTPVGTPVFYQSPLPGGTAPVAGFRGVGFSLDATAANGGSWLLLPGSAGFQVSLGFPLPDGSLGAAGVAQPIPPLGSSPIGTNPLPNVWRAVWTPSSYLPRQCSFHLTSGTDNYLVFVSLGLDPGGNPLFGWARGTDNSPDVSIPSSRPHQRARWSLVCAWAPHLGSDVLAS